MYTSTTRVGHSNGDGMIYICLLSNTTKPVLVELLPNLMMPDQESFPTADDAGTLQRELFLTNSKLMQLINQQEEFEANEQRGMDVGIFKNRPTTESKTTSEA